MAEGGDNSVTLFDKAQDSCDSDVWDDSLLTEAYEKQQRLVERALKERTAGHANGCKSEASGDCPSSTHSSSKVRRVSCDPPPIHCGTVIPKIPIFSVGDACRCVYSADGQEYEADIVELFENRDQCLVRYVGYENEELRTLSKMKPSHGSDARKRQTDESKVSLIREETSDLLQMPSSPEPDITPVSRRSDVSKVINSIAADQEQKRIRESNKKKNRAAKDQLVNQSIILPYRKLDTNRDTESSAGAKVTNAPTTSSSSHLLQQSLPGDSTLCPPPLPPGLLTGRSDEDEALASMLMSWYVSGYHTGYYEAMKKFKK